jgi:hypothetical protein
MISAGELMTRPVDVKARATLSAADEAIARRHCGSIRRYAVAPSPIDQPPRCLG